MDALLVEINYPRILACEEYMVEFGMTINNSLELVSTSTVFNQLSCKDPRLSEQLEKGCECITLMQQYQTWIVGQIHTVQVGLDYHLRRFEVDISETIITPDSSVCKGNHGSPRYSGTGVGDPKRRNSEDSHASRLTWLGAVQNFILVGICYNKKTIKGQGLNAYNILTNRTHLFGCRAEFYPG
ncbi:hypothetical protein B0H19DRAFT_1244055 [Mycena capillaripes]|nr:hypothetical protein B0H19DRAFT_1244055 [Mycena capillaripes]